MSGLTLRVGALAAALVLTAGCSKIEDDTSTTAGGNAEVVGTLAKALSGRDDLSRTAEAVSAAKLGTVFDGPASYTLLAPTNAAFDAQGDNATALMAEEQRAVLAAVLRGHILPGHLAPDSIRQAIARKGGPVSVTTMAGSEVRFAEENGAIRVTGEDGASAALVGDAVTARNGSVLPIDAVLVPPAPDGATAPAA